MGSNGGILEAAEAVAMPAMAVESGPAAGVVAAALVARQTGRRDLLSFDMGGTTAKASLIRDGQYETTPDYEVGGGIEHDALDERHRPSDPRAGDRPCRSLGRRRLDRLGRPGRRAARRPEERRRRSRPRLLRPRRHRADRHRLQPAARLSRQGLAARRAICRSITPRPKPPSRKRLAEPLGVDVRTAAAAVIDVVNHAMAEALKIVSVQRGHDPREFVLAAFGGAGPLHAAALASELGIAEVICPPIPGAFSALGLVGTDLKRDYVRTLLRHRRTPIPQRCRGCLRRTGRARAQPCSTAPASRRSGGASSAPSMRATSANPTSSRCRFRHGAVDQACAGRDRRELP